MEHSYFSTTLFRIKLLTVVVSVTSLVIQKSSAQQNPAISPDLSGIVSPSPTVASLMKFEEIPVNNYTGIPDISIPIFSAETLSADVNLNISLNYHPSSIAAETVAGYSGLGWNLLAGGTISRTVRGYPDEFTRFETASAFGSESPRIGIYDESENQYNLLKEIYTPNSGVYYSDFPEYLWDVHNKGRYDTEHDLYQFNFMGRTGRFYIKSIGSTLQVEKLDHFIEKISIINYYNQTSNKHIITGFTIYDDKGIAYIFTAVEQQSDHQTTTISDLLNNFPNVTSKISPYYNTAYHLTRIIDNNGKDLAVFEYEDVPEKVVYNNRITNEFSNAGSYTSEHRPLGLPDKTIAIHTVYNIDSKKLKKITVTGKSTIDFQLGTGRQDYNLENAQSSGFLNKIIIKNSLGNHIKSFDFNYIYRNHSTKYGKRLFLSSIKENNSSGISPLQHSFKYRDKPVKHGYSLTTDPWGYFTSGNHTYKLYDKNTTDPDMCTTDVLQKMTLPTGGSVIFDFQSNTYSYMGNTLLTNFEENRSNSTYHTQSLSFNVTGSSSSVYCSGNLTPLTPMGFSLKEVRVFPRSPVIPAGGFGLQYFEFRYKKNGVLSTATHTGCWEGNQNCYFTIPNFSISAQYQICFKNLDLDNPNQTVQIEVLYIYERTHPLRYIQGGGVRINRIGYFDEDVPQKYYEGITGGFTPSSQKNYSYHKTIQPSFDEPPFELYPYTISTGSLAYPKPVHKRAYSKNIGYEINYPLTPVYLLFMHPFDFIMRSEKNFISGVDKNGVSVGYKNVTVNNPENGKTEYTYTSPIDFPEMEPSTAIPDHPFLLTRNFEYKRGLLLNEKTYANKEGSTPFNPEYILLSENDYSYNYQENETLSGVKIFSHSDCPALELYSSYQSFTSVCINHPSCPFVNVCDPTLNITVIPFRERYGWAKLDTITTKNYFYEGTSPKIVETSETFDYYSNNKKIKEHTVSNSLGETLKTNYFYDTNHDNRNRIGVIKKIETRRNNNLLETKDISYVNTFSGNSAYLPQTISVSKGSNTPESRIQYVEYDDYSNPLEVKQENGVNIVYLWGYNQAYPIAKIENTTYDQITGALGTITISEAHLTAINNLRTNPAFAESMITTYTYKPLVGVTSITDPRGYTTTYHYDSFGRLEFVKDSDDNILEENKYHYRTQN